MNKYTYTFLVSFTSSLMTVAVCAVFALFFIVQPFQKEAVDRGFATWEVTNNATGSTEFTWNEFAQALHPDHPELLLPELDQPLEKINSKKK